METPKSEKLHMVLGIVLEFVACGIVQVLRLRECDSESEGRILRRGHDTTLQYRSWSWKDPGSIVLVRPLVTVSAVATHTVHVGTTSSRFAC
jgi:hypothetical protein